MSVTARGVAGVVATAGLAAVLTMAYVVATGRLLGPAEYSDFGAALSLVYFAGLAISPLTPTVSRLCAVYVSRKELASVVALRRRVLLLLGGILAVPVAVMCMALPAIAVALNFRSPIALLLAIVVAVFYAIVSIDRGVIHGFFLFGVHNANTIVECAVRLVVGAVLLIAVKRSAPVALSAYVVAMVVAEVALLVRLRSLLPRGGNAAVDWADLKRLTIPMTILMASVAVFQNSDMLMVKRYFPVQFSGAYAAASTLARGIGVLFAPLYIVTSPMLSRLHGEGRPIAAATLRMTGVFVLIAGAALAVMAIWPELIIRVLYGEPYMNASPLLLPIGGVLVITYAGLMLSQALITLSRHRFLVMYAVLAAAQVWTLTRFHSTVGQLFSCMYACQTAALLLVVLSFLNSQKISRDGSSRSSS